MRVAHFPVQHVPVVGVDVFVVGPVFNEVGVVGGYGPRFPWAD